VLDDVREVSRGLHPALLSRSGLAPAIRELARRSPIPVEIDIDLPTRPPASIETAVYYIIAEALTNAIKHSEGSKSPYRSPPTMKEETNCCTQRSPTTASAAGIQAKAQA